MDKLTASDIANFEIDDAAGLKKSLKASFDQARTRILKKEEKIAESLRTGKGAERVLDLMDAIKKDIEDMQRSAFQYQTLQTARGAPYP